MSSLQRRFLSIPFALLGLLGLLACGAQEPATPAAEPTRVAVPSKPEGHLDRVDDDHVHGWVWDAARPNEVVSVDIYADSQLLATVAADRFRQDLRAAGKGNGKHAFRHPIPARLRDGRPHEIRVEVSKGGTELKGSPQTRTFPPRG